MAIIMGILAPISYGVTSMYTPIQFDARREQMLKELASDMADLVASGDMTDEQANEWVTAKADQWKEPS